MFPKIAVPQNGWFIKMENPIKHGMIWGKTPLFLETSNWCQKSWISCISSLPPPASGVSSSSFDRSLDPGSGLGEWLRVLLPLGQPVPSQLSRSLLSQLEVCHHKSGCFSKNSGCFPPNHPILMRFSHYFHHPFWGKIRYFWKHP